MPAPQSDGRAERPPERGLVRAFHLVLGGALLFIVAVNVVNALGRHLLGQGVTGADELMIYTMVWIVFAGAVGAMAMREHLAVDLLPGALPPRARHAVHALHDVLAVVICLYAASASWSYVGRISALGVESMALGLPMTIPHAALLAGYLGLAAVAAWALRENLSAALRPAPVNGRRAA